MNCGYCRDCKWWGNDSPALAAIHDYPAWGICRAIDDEEPSIEAEQADETG